ncbi:MAG TPA: choice-of-anchor tandem repeat GloVer-containing protein [Rhizomicrobium sp.]|nr:choice-of-anchor tandem repeat GloVer-containing protein [Rhizomicrobium sp.]
MNTASIALLAGMIGGAFADPGAEAATFAEKVVHAFAGGTDGSAPWANLLDEKGILYGTTTNGGKGCHWASGCGTAFSIDKKTGMEAVLHAFGQRSLIPYAGLIDVNGKLYGTTFYGGTESCGGCGTVFSVSRKTGAEKVLHAFAGSTDGAAPTANLTDVNGTLYGTTVLGGRNCADEGGCGTVFSLDPKTRAETVLYSFCNQQNCVDGTEPEAGLIDVNGILYGTTCVGGADSDGTVFSLDPNTGAETMLHSFAGGSADGEYPVASLIDVDGTLYGTTREGGTDNDGTVFALDPGTGVETVLYSFAGGADGAYPTAGLINVAGTLYGTTASGGGTGCSPDPGCGTAFSLDPSTGTEKVIHSFCSEKNCADGAQPRAGLIDVKGALYGTTVFGGGNDCSPGPGCGTVFALTKD